MKLKQTYDNQFEGEYENAKVIINQDIDGHWKSTIDGRTRMFDWEIDLYKKIIAKFEELNENKSIR